MSGRDEMSNPRSSEVTIILRNALSTRLTVVLEPWANDYLIEPGLALRITEKNGDSSDPIELEFSEGQVVIWGRTGSTLSVIEVSEKAP